jgi:hypothetical protein
MKYSVSQILKAKESLAALPRITIESKDQVTSLEAITLLADELAALQKKGYSVEQMAKALSDQGIIVSLTTLRRYLRRAGVGQPGRKKQKPVTDAKPAKSAGGTTAATKVPTTSPKQAKSREAKTAPKSSEFTVRKDTEDL